LPTTAHPIRVRVVSCAIAASIVQVSKIGPSSRAPSVAKWSITQQLSKPASSARRQRSRSCSMVAF
jgi:hypothetical protein